MANRIVLLERRDAGAPISPAARQHYLWENSACPSALKNDHSQFV
ncbi:hypothetical protein ABTY63_06505 [Streptomyces solisilvae]